MVKNSGIGNLLKRERLLMFSGLAFITVLAWTYMLHMAWKMVGKGMDINLACLGYWGLGDLTHMFINSIEFFKAVRFKTIWYNAFCKEALWIFHDS